MPKMKADEAWEKYGPFTPLSRFNLHEVDPQRLLSVIVTDDCMPDRPEDMTPEQEEEYITGEVGFRLVNVDGYYLSARQMPTDLFVVDIWYGDPPAFPRSE